MSAPKLPSLAQVVLKHDFVNSDSVTYAELRRLIAEDRKLTPREGDHEQDDWGQEHSGLINDGTWMDDGQYVFFHMEEGTYIDSPAAVSVHYTAATVKKYAPLALRATDIVLKFKDLWDSYERWCEQRLQRPRNADGFRDDMMAAYQWPGAVGEKALRVAQALVDKPGDRTLTHVGYRHLMDNAPCFARNYTWKHPWTQKYFESKWVPSVDPGGVEAVAKGPIPLRAALRIILWDSEDQGTLIDPRTGAKIGDYEP